jgi:hypothetical protein
MDQLGRYELRFGDVDTKSDDHRNSTPAGRRRG